MPFSRWISFVLLAVACVPISAMTAIAADAPAKSPPAKDAAVATTAASQLSDKELFKQWGELIARRDAMLADAMKIQQAFRAAKPQEQAEMYAKLEKMQAEFGNTIQPNVFRLAPEVYKRKPADMDAAGVVVGLLMEKNKYNDVIKLVDPMIANPKFSDPMILNLAGNAHFAVHDFDKAHTILERAKKIAPDSVTPMSEAFLENCVIYADLWKREQAIRADEAKADDLPRVQFKTTKGIIVLELFENEAPNTVANFISLVEAKKYDGTKFHRVIPGFMAQGGDPNSLDADPANDGQGGPGYHIDCECYADNARKHFQGSLSMAHAGKDTGGSQFFLTHLPTPHLNSSTEPQERGHTVFGRIIKGLDVALSLEIGDKIETATVLRKRDHAYKPVTTDAPGKISFPPVKKRTGKAPSADGT